MDKPKGTVLVTGAAGFSGRHACGYFASRGYKVVGVVRKAPQAGSLARPDGIVYTSCDLTRSEEVLRLIESAQADYVLHLAGKNAVKESWEDPLSYMETNVMAVVHLLEALRRTGSKAKVVLASSRLRFKLSDHPSPNHPYGLSKSLGGMAALCWSQLFGQEVVIGEPSNLIGPGPSTGICALLARYIVRAERGMKQEPFRLSSGQEVRDFLDVRDAASAYEHLLLKGETGRIIPVCSGRGRTLNETAAAFRALASVPVAIEEEHSPSTSPSGNSVAFTPSAELANIGWKPSFAWEASVRDILDYWRGIDF